MGSQWQHNYSQKLQFINGGVGGTPKALNWRTDGTIIEFRAQNGVWLADADINSKLGTTSVNNVTLWLYTSANDTTETYDSTGKLIGITDRTQRSQTLSYDSQNRLSQITDDIGRQLSFQYDSANRISQMTDPAGGLYSYAYDTAGNLISVTNPDNSTRQYLYGETANISATPNANVDYSHALTGLIDENGVRYATYSYDASGLAIATQHADHNDLYRISYTTNNLQGTAHTATVTDPLGTSRSTTFTNILGVPRITANTQPGGSGCNASSSAISYDANGNVASRTDFNGNRTDYSYDLTRNLETSRTEGLSATGAATLQTRTITTLWHPTYRLPTQISEPGLETSYTYDTHGNVTQKSLQDTASGNTRTWNTRYTYASSVPGALLQKTIDGPRTDVSDLTIYDYYAPDATCSDGSYGCRGQLRSITNALGHSTQITGYNANAQAVTLIDPNGLVTTLSYDARQRISRIAVGTEITQYHYDNVGQLTQTLSPDGGTLNYRYDAAHRLIQISDGLGNTLNYTLDAAGNRIHEDTLDPSGILVQTRSRQYDALSRLYQDIGAANQTTVYTYDANGNLTGVTDPLNRSTRHSYSTLDQLIQSVDPANGIRQNSYDARDNLTRVTDPRNNATQYTYDGLNNLTQEISPDRGTTRHTYDAAGNPLTSIDARGVKQSNTYDALNRLTQRMYTTVSPIPATTTTSWVYDQGTNAKGRLSSMTDETGNTAYSYDQQGRLLSKTQTTTYSGVSKVHTLTYSYNSAGQISTQTTPANNLLSYSYDAQGRINSITANGKILLNNLQYQPFGAPQSWTWGNGSPYTRSFDTDGRPTRYPIADTLRTLNYDSVDNIIGYRHSTNSTNNRDFSYSLLDQLTAELDTSGNGIRYQYDANGNRASISVLGSTPRPYAIASDGTRTLAWNAANRLKSATVSNKSTTYSYNGHGERLIKTGSSLSNTPWRFVYDSAGHLVGEYDSTNIPRQETVWLGDIPVAVIKKDPGTGSLSNFYLQSDHLNTPRVILNSANIPLWRWDSSDAFGVGLANADPDGDGKAFEYNLRLPGQYYDTETGLHYNYFRDYNPATGRYIASDPIGLKGGLNTYGYVGGNPVGAVDPTGQNAITDGAMWGSRLGGGLAGPGGAIAGAVVGGLGGAVVNSVIEQRCYSNGPKCDELNSQVQNAKNKVGKLGACQAGMSRRELQERYNAWLEEAISRAKRDEICWNGGDLGHQEAQAQAWINVANCSRLIQ